jgi:hypothetical protein
LVPAAHTQEFPPVYVLSENMSENADGCGYTHASIEATVKSELRHNRVPIATEEDYASDKAIVAYIETLGDNRLGYGQCLVGYRFSLVVPQIVRITVTQEVRWEKIELCRRWGTMTSSVADVQPTLNNQFRDFTSQCITEYLEQ